VQPGGPGVCLCIPSVSCACFLGLSMRQQHRKLQATSVLLAVRSETASRIPALTEAVLIAVRTPAISVSALRRRLKCQQASPR